MIDRLPEDTQTLYSELLALLLARAGERDLSHLSGTFTTKRVKGADYVYSQYSDPGGAKRQFSIGRQGPKIRAIVAGYERGRKRLRSDPRREPRGVLLTEPLEREPHALLREVVGRVAASGEGALWWKPRAPTRLTGS